MTLDEIKAIVHELDPVLSERGTTFKTALLLLASLEVGPDVNALVQFTGLSALFVRCRAERLERNGVWSGGQVHCDWMDEEAGAVAFWMDVCVAEGQLERAPAAAGTEEGR